MGSEDTIFFADNDTQSANKFCRELDRAGYTVERCPLNTLPNALDGTPQGIVVMNLGNDVAAGLQIQQQLSADGRAWPVIFIADCEYIPEAVKAIKAGAIDFHVTTAPTVDLLKSVAESMIRLDAEKTRQRYRDTIEKRCATLSRRELEIMEHITSGVTNRDIASQLGLSQRTIEVHRSRLMGKMQAANITDLTRMVDQCRLCNPNSE